MSVLRPNQGSPNKKIEIVNLFSEYEEETREHCLYSSVITPVALPRAALANLQPKARPRK